VRTGNHTIVFLFYFILFYFLLSTDLNFQYLMQQPTGSQCKISSLGLSIHPFPSSQYSDLLSSYLLPPFDEAESCVGKKGSAHLLPPFAEAGSGIDMKGSAHLLDEAESSVGERAQRTSFHRLTRRRAASA
jgi:hypothetical protein